MFRCGWLKVDSEELLKKIRGAGRTDMKATPAKSKKNSKNFHSTTLKLSKNCLGINDLDLPRAEINLDALRDNTVPWVNITLPEQVPDEYCQLGNEPIIFENPIDLNNAEQMRKGSIID